MRKIVVAVYQSLDGVMQAPGGPTEDPSNGFSLGGWIQPLSDERTGAAVELFLAKPYALLLGRRTYDIFSGYWPKVGNDNPVAAAVNSAAKHVLTHRPDPLHWHNSHRLAGISGVHALKASAGPDHFVWGSGSLTPQLLAAGLVDRLLLMTFPVVLGAGKRLFGPGTPPLAMRLVASEISSGGVIIARYEPAGPVLIGTFADPKPDHSQQAPRGATQ